MVKNLLRVYLLSKDILTKLTKKGENMASVTLKGNAVSLAGNELNVGDNAPEVEVVAQDLSKITLGGSQEAKQVIISLPSLDTPVCASEARKFNEKVASLNAKVVIVSMDLPFAMGRFCTTEGIANLKVGSDFTDKSFSNKYGVLVNEGPLKGVCARAIFIVDTNGKISYKQIVPELTDEPNYEEVLANI